MEEQTMEPHITFREKINNCFLEKKIHTRCIYVLYLRLTYTLPAIGT